MRHASVGRVLIAAALAIAGPANAADIASAKQAITRSLDANY
ncbi:MAG: hypothetical protein JWR77_2680, partial [Rhizorhabdus sp.]|nr:hypothetical protein [Rhizorhabdus sp.]